MSRTMECKVVAGDLRADEGMRRLIPCMWVFTPRAELLHFHVHEFIVGVYVVEVSL